MTTTGFLHCYDGVRLCVCRTEAANGPTVNLPDVTRVNMEQLWNYTEREKLDSDKTLSQPLILSQIPHGLSLGVIPGLRGETPVLWARPHPLDVPQS
jgi:hypothetical protein